MARLTTCLAILVVISLILQQQPVTGFPRPFRSFLKAQSRDLDESNDEANDEAHDEPLPEEMAGSGLTCWVFRFRIACGLIGMCDDCERPSQVKVLIKTYYHCGIGCDREGHNCQSCRS